MRDYLGSSAPHLGSDHERPIALGTAIVALLICVALLSGVAGAVLYTAVMR